jgi:lipoprotein-anchoring transpeptidase ErfK/SrfK
MTVILSRHALSRRSFVGLLLPGATVALAGCAGVPLQQQSARTDGRSTRVATRYDTREKPGTIVVDPANYHLYLVQGGGQALQYGVGVGREGFGWSGAAIVHSKQEWPDWYPPREMLERKPEIAKAMVQMQGGMGMPGGPENPLGARALYLWQGNKDTLYRIHGTNEPDTIGQNVSSGCIRLLNQDVVDLYDRVQVGSRVVVLSQAAV